MNAAACVYNIHSWRTVVLITYQVVCNVLSVDRFLYSRWRLKEMLMTFSSVKLFRLGIKAHLRCVDEGESPTWIQQTISLA